MTKARSEEVLMAGSDLDARNSGRVSAKLSPTPFKPVVSSPARKALVTLGAISREISS